MEPPTRLRCHDISSGVPVTVLVLHSDALVLLAVESMLASNGYRVLPASDPTAAATHIVTHGRAPDVLLTEVTLREASGIEYARSLRTRYPSLGIVLTTDLPHCEAQARHSGIGEVLRRPFRAADLFAAIERSRANVVS
jgi:CheY-like chemotaxis protein